MSVKFVCVCEVGGLDVHEEVLDWLWSMWIEENK